MTDKDRWEMVRRAIEHEDHLTNHRLTWLLTAQGFLVGGFFLAQNSVHQLKSPLTQALSEFALAIVFFGGIRLCMIVGVAVALASEQIHHLQDWSKQLIYKYPSRKMKIRKTPWLARVLLISTVCLILIDLASYLISVSPRGFLFSNDSMSLSLSKSFTIFLYAVFIIYVISVILLGPKPEELPEDPFDRAYGVLTWWYFTTPPYFEWPIRTVGSTPPVVGQFDVPRMLSVRWIPAIFMFLNLIFMSICLGLCLEYSEKVKGNDAFEKAPLYVKSIKYSENPSESSFEIQFEASGYEKEGLTIDTLDGSQEFDRVLEKLRSKMKNPQTSVSVLPASGKPAEPSPGLRQKTEIPKAPSITRETSESEKAAVATDTNANSKSTTPPDSPKPDTDRSQSKSEPVP